MTLTARLTGFFLGVLAVVLCGFSLTLWLLTRSYLSGQITARLEASLQALSATAELGEQGVEWEAGNHNFQIGVSSAADEVRWLVRDDHGRQVDHSVNLNSSSLNAILESAVSQNEEPWRIESLVLPRVSDNPQLTGSPDGRPASGVKSFIVRSDPPEIQRIMYPKLTITAAISLAPRDAALRALAGALAGSSIFVWTLAALFGRWLGRKALLPVTRMSEAARAMTADAWPSRLPESGTHDELEQFAQAFNDLLSRLQESFERQRRFTGNASHQLRTPLAGMIGQIGVSLRRDRPPEEYRRVLTNVQIEAGRLRQIIESLLFLANANADALSPQMLPVDLASWLPLYLQTCKMQGCASDIQFEVIAKGEIVVRVHAGLLSQLVDNLFDNAAKYSPAGSPIRVRLSVEDCQAVLSVRDFGCGISHFDLPQIFEPFYRAPTARVSGISGMGLGLAVAKQIATAIGCDLSVESVLTEGSQFNLRFPLLREPRLAPAVCEESVKQELHIRQRPALRQ